MYLILWKEKEEREGGWVVQLKDQNFVFSKMNFEREPSRGNR